MRNDYGKGVYNTWRAWWHWHQWAYDFHTTLDTRHPYQSDSPFQWLVQGRPTLFAYTSTPHGPHCAALNGCSQTVLDLGNVAIWWPAILAVLGCIWLWVGRRDWRAALILVGVVADILPWLPYPSRTKFNFYALPMLPFLILALCAMAGLALGQRTDSERRRLWGAMSVGLYAMLVIVASGTSTRSGLTSGCRTTPGTTGSPGSPAGSSSPAGRPAPSTRRAGPSCRACRAPTPGSSRRSRCSSARGGRPCAP